MIRREEQRLRSVFRRALALALAAPLAGSVAMQACSTKDPAGSPDDAGVDATSGGDDAGIDAPNFLQDAGNPDRYVNWCEAGPPVLVDGSALGFFCDFIESVPCGLLPGVTVDDAGNVLNVLDCYRMCTFDAGTNIYGCKVPFFDGSTAPPVTFECDLCGGHGGRKPKGLRRPVLARSGDALGGYFARMAHLEAASVHAFRTMRSELKALGAPHTLVRAAERSARDEMRHARVTARLARKHGAAVPRVRVGRAAPRSLEAMARENAVEGCVRETFGALVASWQARHAKDGAIAGAMRTIARDEGRHAALAWAFDRWAAARLDAAARARVASARREAVRVLQGEVQRELAPSLVTAAGLPSRAHAARLVEELCATLWS
jgi:hypothetical protein